MMARNVLRSIIYQGGSLRACESKVQSEYNVSPAFYKSTAQKVAESIKR